MQYSLLPCLRPIVKRAGPSHAEVARSAGTSGKRVTAILRGNLVSVSTGLLIRILTSLGCRVRVTVTKDNQSGAAA